MTPSWQRETGCGGSASCGNRSPSAASARSPSGPTRPSAGASPACQRPSGMSPANASGPRSTGSSRGQRVAFVRPCGMLVPAALLHSLVPTSSRRGPASTPGLRRFCGRNPAHLRRIRSNAPWPPSSNPRAGPLAGRFGLGGLFPQQDSPTQCRMLPTRTLLAPPLGRPSTYWPRGFLWPFAGIPRTVSNPYSAALPPLVGA